MVEDKHVYIPSRHFSRTLIDGVKKQIIDNVACGDSDPKENHMLTFCLLALQGAGEIGE